MKTHELRLFRSRNVLNLFAATLLLCCVLGCGQGPNPNIPVRKIHIPGDGAFSVVAEVSEATPAEGVIVPKSIVVSHRDNLPIGSVEAMVYYDRDRSGDLDRKKDGVILSIENSVGSPSGELAISPGPVHSGPGIGALRLAGKVDVVCENGERSSIPLNVDLSSIFSADETP